MKKFSYNESEITHFYKCSYCQKNGYNSWIEADRVRMTQNKNLRIYKCPHNNGFHLTSDVHSENQEKALGKYFIK